MSDVAFEAKAGETDFLGVVSLTQVSPRQAVERLAERDAAAPFVFVVTPNAAHVTSLAKPGSPYRAAYDAAWMRLCDGQAIRLLGRVLFGQQLELVTGSDLTVLLLREVIHPDDPITVIGGDDRLRRALQEQFGLTRLHQHQPPMGYITQPDEVQRCVDAVLAHPARFVFIITGSPRSEQLLLRIAQTGQATGIGLSVGSSLAFATGLVPRAPEAMRRAGLEWLFRLGRDPRGHARRVFMDSLPIVQLALRAKLRRHKLDG